MNGSDHARYDPRAAERRWSAFWEADGTFRTRDDGVGGRRYLLDMFAYPSGDLHMGHAEAWAISDAVARYWFMRGHDVMHPVGWDSFGLPAENAAIRRGTHPAEWTYRNIETQAASFRRYGIAVDWERRLHTSDPEYYRWTQWLFLRLREAGLAERRESFVTWCPHDQTVLAREQVVEGRCERCDTLVTRRRLTQWYLRTGDYAQRMLDDMALVEDGWPSRVLAMQRRWIGRSEGAYVTFPVPSHDTEVTVFTTRPDTLGGVTFLAVAPEGDLSEALCTPDRRAALAELVARVGSMSDVERGSTVGETRGAFLGTSARNPLTGQEVPIWAAEHVLPDYGTGAVMGVPAHDQRDLDLALRHGLPVRVVVDTGEDPVATGRATTGPGTYVAPDLLAGLQDRDQAVRVVGEALAAAGAGRLAVSYGLRDWLISRQRYWGCPIPVVHCPVCGEVAVPDAELPVRLPDLAGAQLAPRGRSPLAAAEDWVRVPCPRCGGPAARDTDTMDTFVDSSWYLFRYCSPRETGAPFRAEDVARWMPVDLYVGGVEHATMHLLYLRYLTKVMHDLGLVPFTEPVRALLNQGQVVNQGRAMSKSLGNGVDLGEQIDRHGVDAVRLTLVFAGPPEADIDWADLSPGSSARFLQRAYRLARDVTSEPGSDPATGDVEVRRATHRTVEVVTDLLESRRLNVAVARVMELVNLLRKAMDTAPGPADPAVREGVEVATQMLSLVAPYVAEEMWEALGCPPPVARSRWPVADPALTAHDSTTCVVQVGGKVRARLQVAPDATADALLDLALAEPAVARALAGREVHRVVTRPPHLVNVVPAASG